MGNPKTFLCHKSDLRYIRINCRCGEKSIAEVPQQLAAGHMIHPCPACGRVFEIHQREDKTWDIKPTGNIRDSAYVVSEPQPMQQEHLEPVRFAVGTKVRIVDGTQLDFGDGVHGNNPHPEHIGKLGVITSIRMVEGTQSPVIELVDGAVVGGWECWWEPAGTGEGN
jgi:hypothetical protein